MNSENKKYLVSLSYFYKFGPVRLKNLMTFFEDAKKVFEASVKDLIKSGLKEKIALEFVEYRKDIDSDKIWDALKKENIKVVDIESDDYPDLLSRIHTPPYLLFYKGNLPGKEDLNLAFVGSRKCTQYGIYAVDNIVSNLVNLKTKINIISGLAFGIDSVAHQVALRNSIKTIAVLGSGIDDVSIYPQSNIGLANKIIENGGAVISEFPPGTKSLRHHFPQRNRIVAGMSSATIVIEAEKKSGALITSKYALDENRDVFALPGQINSQVSVGTNNLIKSGAIPLTCAEDIIEFYDIENEKSDENKVDLNKIEEQIFSCLGHEPIHVNQISKITSIAVSELNGNLTMMEIRGIVKNVGGMQYIKV